MKYSVKHVLPSRDSSAVRRFFFRLAGAVVRQSALHKENSGFAAELRRQIRCFPSGERFGVPRLQQVGGKKAVERARQRNLGLVLLVYKYNLAQKGGPPPPQWICLCDRVYILCRRSLLTSTIQDSIQTVSQMLRLWYTLLSILQYTDRFKVHYLLHPN